MTSVRVTQYCTTRVPANYSLLNVDNGKDGEGRRYFNFQS